MKKIILILILILPLVYAQENYNQYSSLDLSLEISSSIIIEELTDPELGSIDLALYLFPRESERQTYSTLELNSNPEAETNIEDQIIFHWEDYEEQMDYSLDSIITTENIIYEIPKTEFPILDIPEEIETYLLETISIDITQDISEKASELTSQETDLYLAVHNIADWVNKNIVYDLNTLTAESVQKSSWVFENKEGVCDEITALFISMLRSVGVPARFVGGVTYTNLDYTFQNHGWAEVYFPDYGWVPYDVTFTQYGWISPGHIELSKTQDPKDPSITLSSISKDLVITAEVPSIETEVQEEYSLIDPILDISLELLTNNVAPESYVPFRVKLKNPLNNYISTNVFVTTAPGLTEENSKTIALKPYEEKELFWIVTIPYAEPYKTYQTKIEVEDMFGSEAETTITYSNDFSLFTKEQADSIIDSLTQEDSYSYLLTISCSLDKDYYYSFEDLTLTCNLENLAEDPLEDLNICFNNCQSISLIEEKEIIFNLKAEDVPENKILTITGEDVTLNKYISLQIYNPEIQITDINVPSILDYSDSTDISFSLTSETTLKNIELEINNQVILSLEELEGVKPIKLSTSGKSLLSGINIKVTYEDEYGNEYITEKTKEIEITNTPFYAKFFELLRNLF